MEMLSLVPSHPPMTRSVGLVAKFLHSKWRTAKLSRRRQAKVALRPPPHIDRAEPLDWGRG